MMQISVNSVAYFFTKLQKYVGDFCLTELRKVECLMHVKNMNFSIFTITYDYILIDSFATYRKIILWPFTRAQFTRKESCDQQHIQVSKVKWIPIGQPNYQSVTRECTAKLLKQVRQCSQYVNTCRVVALSLSLLFVNTFNSVQMQSRLSVAFQVQIANCSLISLALSYSLYVSRKQ